MQSFHAESKQRRGLARQKSLASESGLSLRTDQTWTGTGTNTFDLHTMLTLHEFPAPPTKIIGSASTPSATAGSSPAKPPSTNMSVEESHNTYSNHEEVLQDDYIARLLVSNSPETTVPSLDRLRIVPHSPTVSARTRRPSRPGTSSSPSDPSPATRMRIPPSVSTISISNPDPLVSGSDSPRSRTSFRASNTHSSSSRSRRTTIVRLDSPTLPPSNAATSVVGFARASYIPKSAASTPPPPIIIPSVYGSSNLIDLSSPLTTPPRSPQRVALSPRVSHLSGLESTLPPVHENLAPTPQTPRFRVSMSPHPVSPLPSPSDEAPPNVPEDVTSPDDPGPSTPYLVRGGTLLRRRFSMSSLFSRFSKSSAHSSSLHRPRFAWAPRSRFDPPPVPALPMDRTELQKTESSMPLPALVSRAGYLSHMLDSGRLPVRNSASTYHGLGSNAPVHVAEARSVEPQVNPEAIEPGSPDEVPWDYSSGDGYVDDTAVRNRRSQSIRSFFTRGTTTDRSGHFHVLDEDLQRRYHEELAASARASSGRLGSDIEVDNAPISALGSPVHSEKSHRASSFPATKPLPLPPRRPWWAPHPKAPWRWKKRTLFAVTLNVAFLFAIIGVAVGLTSSNKHRITSNSGVLPGEQYKCAVNWTGSSCDLDATCHCTSADTVCNPLAVAIENFLPATNSLLGTNYTSPSVARTLWDMQGSPVGGNCAQQALLLDIDTRNADQAHQSWARAAVLYSALQSEDLVAAQALRTFVDGLNFGSATTAPATTFQRASSGFDFDFQAMTVTAPPLKWQIDADPSPAEVSQLSSDLEVILDKFTSSASALSNQTTNALQNFWTKDLGMQATLLPVFLNAFRTAPILLPFDMSLDANDASLATIMQLHPPKTMSFPPPLACNPMMDSATLKALNAVEQSVFGLPAISSIPVTFDPTCFASRPVYGVLDILGLRLPFEDGLKNAPLQAAALVPAAATRAIIRTGIALSTYPSGPGLAIPPYALQTSNYGTLDHLDHVALAYLQSVSVYQAQLLASFICGVSSAALNGTTLNASPTVEVALLGPVGPDDVDHSISSFSTPSGSLFFGSQTGNVFRQWAANTAMSSSNSVVWAQSSIASQVVREKLGNDTTFEQVWNGASTMIANAEALRTTTGPSDLSAVIGAFTSLDYFSD